jgi:hypothetical protein
LRRRCSQRKGHIAPLPHLPRMADWIESEKCQFCGKQAKQFAFAAFLCDSEECLDKAREERGGPGGHMKAKQEGRPIVFDEDEK